MMAEAAWQCGDPGIQYDTTINDWHTCPNTARINGSNPCVTGDTMVATAEGWRRIDSLVGRTALVVGLDGQPHVVTRVFPTGTKPVFRLRTKAGYEVRITADHKVWTLEGGRAHPASGPGLRPPGPR
jgi:ribonucleoside-diphosphate reductase alpha chain